MIRMKFRHTRGIAQSRERISRMVQDIDKHTAIKGLVRKRQMKAIEANARNGGVGTGNVFRAGYGEALHGLAHNLRAGAVSASYVKQRRGFGKHGCKPLAKRGNTTLINQFPVSPAKQLDTWAIAHNHQYKYPD